MHDDTLREINIYLHFVLISFPCSPLDILHTVPIPCPFYILISYPVLVRFTYSFLTHFLSILHTHFLPSPCPFYKLISCTAPVHFTYSFPTQSLYILHTHFLPSPCPFDILISYPVPAHCTYSFLNVLSY